MKILNERLAKERALLLQNSYINEKQWKQTKCAPMFLQLGVLQPVFPCSIPMVF